MRVKNVNVSFKTGPEDGLEEGQFKVYPSTFIRQRDTYGDVVAKGAFLDSIKAWEESGDVLPAMYMHDPNQIVGGASEMGEDEHGWWVKGFFDDDPASQRIYNLVKGRRLTSLSFAFSVLDEGRVKLEDGSQANELRKVDVHEFSFLPKGFAANEDTSVVTVKTVMDRFTNEEIAALKEIAAQSLAPEEGEVDSKPDEAPEAGNPEDLGEAVSKSIGEVVARISKQIDALAGAEMEGSK